MWTILASTASPNGQRERVASRTDKEFYALIAPLCAAYIAVVIACTIYVLVHPFGDEFIGDMIDSVSHPSVLTTNIVAVCISLPFFLVFIAKIGRKAPISIPSLGGLLAISSHHVPRIVVFVTSLGFKAELYVQVCAKPFFPVVSQVFFLAFSPKSFLVPHRPK